LDLLDAGNFEEYWTSAVVFAWNARLAAHFGRERDAHDLLARASRLRPLMTAALPVVSVTALLGMTRAHLGLHDVSGASATLRQAQDILQQRPQLGRLAVEADDLQRQLDARPASQRGGPTLTAAELQLAPYLVTHLTLQEIGQRLFVSRSTVKSHVSSIYAKCRVRTRSDAVDKLYELGLIPRTGRMGLEADGDEL
jgi:LuxR family maltose regulon positive regulatory protein